MEVKIGVAESPRELVVSSAQTPEEVTELVDGALSGSSSTLSLMVNLLWPIVPVAIALVRTPSIQTKTGC